LQTLNVDYLKGQSQILNIVQKDNIKNNLLTLFVGIAGAWVGYILNIPLGPMLGALVFVLIAKRTYSALKLSRYFSSLALCLSGIFMGSRFPKDFSSAFFSWETSLLAVPLFVLVSVLSITLYLKFVPKYNLSTSVLSAFPGGILTMIGLGSATKSREDIILSTHTIRIIMTVVTIPFVLTFYGYRAGENILSEDEIFTLSDFTSYEILVVLSVSILSLIFAKIIKLPAGELVGPMFGVGFLYSAGMVVGEIPSIILIFVLWLLGSNLGIRFPQINIAALLKLLLHGIVIFVILLLFSLIFTVLLIPFSNQDPLTIFLAFAPGGLGEMATIGLVFGANPVFISIHHVVRAISCALFAIFLGKWFLNK